MKRIQLTRAELSAKAYEVYSNSSFNYSIDDLGNYCVDSSAKFNSLDQLNRYLEEIYDVVYGKEED